MDWNGYDFGLRHAFVEDTPGVFFVEVVGRTVLLFLVALFLVRALGKRALGQMSPYEFVVLIAMGSALGDPMFYPNVPLLPPMTAMATIVLLQRLVSWVSERSEHLERFVEGRPREFVRDGEAVPEHLKKESIAFDELAMMLRQQGIENLAEVRLAIFESSGKLSVFPRSSPGRRWGLPLEALVPGAGQRRYRAGETADLDTMYACVGCGHCRRCAAGQRLRPCAVCACEEALQASEVEDADVA